MFRDLEKASQDAGLFFVCATSPHKMQDRFTHTSKFGRRNISEKDRLEVYRRDDYRCQYCLKKFESRDGLSIDHLVPVMGEGMHDIRNYVTCCRSCNSRKKDKPLSEFIRTMEIELEDLPLHGDPVSDNENIPLELRMIRRQIFDAIRSGEIIARGKAAQQKIEKEYRRRVWNTDVGKELIEKYPDLPGQARIMLPEIVAIAKTEDEEIMLIELSKTADTRNLIGQDIKADTDVLNFVVKRLAALKDEKKQKRLKDAITRAEKEIRKGSSK